MKSKIIGFFMENTEGPNFTYIFKRYVSLKKRT
jgi:hypothetical protein